MEWTLRVRRGRGDFASSTETLPAIIEVLDDRNGDPSSAPTTGAGAADVVAFACTADADPEGRLPPCWLGPDRYDDGPTDDRIRSILAARPKARLVADIVSCSPAWWDERHPEDLVVWHDGATDRPLGHGCLKTRVPCLASQRWREAMGRNVARLVEHIESSPHRDRVVAYRIRFGARGSWIHFGTLEGYVFDYNPQVTARFRSWLARRYPDDAALATAWGRPVRLDAVLPPGPEERAAVDPRGFRHPVAQRHVIDFSCFLTDLTAEAIAAVTSAAKQACGHRCPVGVPFGDFFGLAAVQDGLPRSGQLAFGRVLEDPHLDFVVAPLAPEGVEGGGTAALSAAPAASARLHGKVLLHEVGVAGNASGHRWTDVLGDPAGVGRGRAPHPPRVALVLDDTSMYVIQRPADQFAALLTAQAHELARLGAPVDVVLFSDLHAAPAYRFLVFPNLFLADRATRRALHARLRAHRATALWLTAAGFVEDEPGFENIESLVGIRIVKPETPHTGVIVSPDGPAAFRYGHEAMHAHLPVIEDPACEILGVYADSRRPGLGQKTQDGWHSIFSGAPAVCAELLERFARAAGALDDGQVLAP